MNSVKSLPPNLGWRLVLGDSQRCGHPWQRLGRCCVSRTRWAPGGHAEAHTPARRVRRRPPPHRSEPAGNHLSGLEEENTKKSN